MKATPMTRDDVERIVREARERDARPSLCGVYLRGVDLYGADLTDTNLTGANLTGADLTDANLADADLTDANLSGSNLSGADLFGSDMHGANLGGTNLYEANLLWARGVVFLGHTPSGPTHMVPLPNRTWRLTIGCWDGTTTGLRTLIAGDDWPEARGVERNRRRPVLESLADHADNLAAYHDDWLTSVVERWGDKETTR